MQGYANPLSLSLTRSLGMGCRADFHLLRLHIFRRLDARSADEAPRKFGTSA